MRRRGSRRGVQHAIDDLRDQVIRHRDQIVVGCPSPSIVRICHVLKDSTSYSRLTPSRRIGARAGTTTSLLFLLLFVTNHGDDDAHRRRRRVNRSSTLLLSAIAYYLSAPRLVRDGCSSQAITTDW